MSTSYTTCTGTFPSSSNKTLVCREPPPPPPLPAAARTSLSRAGSSQHFKQLLLLLLLQRHRFDDDDYCDGYRLTGCARTCTCSCKIVDVFVFVVSAVCTVQRLVVPGWYSQCACFFRAFLHRYVLVPPCAYHLSYCDSFIWLSVLY